MDSTCIFCKIIDKQIPADIVRETERVLVIKDRAPKAPVHYLIMPKKHIKDLHELTDQDTPLFTDMANTVRALAADLPEPKAFNLISNNGAQAGQSVFHMHAHFLAGRNIYEGGLAL